MANINDYLLWRGDIPLSRRFPFNEIDSMILSRFSYLRLDKITLTININNRENADYCFELNSKNCRLIEVHSSKCWIEIN